jgi:methionine salvage enolase-phosphatase E1
MPVNAKMPPSSIRLRKPNAIVMDVTGTIATKAFMTYSQESKDFLRSHIREYVSECWNKKELRLSVNFIKTEQDLRGCADGQPPIADTRVATQQQIEALISNILWRMDNERLKRSAALGLFHLYMSEWGYKKNFLRTPVYDDAPASLAKWKTADNIKVYIALGSANLLRSVFSQTSAGDLLPFIDGHMNLMNGSIKDFTRLPELLKEPASRILFITRLPQDARLASRAEIRSVVVVRQDFDPNGVHLLLKKLRKRTSPNASRKEPKGDDGKGLSLVSSTVGATVHSSNIMISPASCVAPPSSIGGAPPSNVQNAGQLPDEDDLSVASKLTAKDIREFLTVQRLDEIQWD